MTTVLDQFIADRNKQTLGASLDLAFERDPVREADIARISKDTLIPDDLIEHNLDEAKVMERRRKISESTLLQNNPGLAQFLMNPQNAAIAQKHIDSLSRLESVVAPKQRAAKTDLLKKGMHNYLAGANYQQAEAQAKAATDAASSFDRMADSGLMSEKGRERYGKILGDQVDEYAEGFAEDVAEMAENREAAEAIKHSPEVEKFLSGETHWWEALKRDPGLLIAEMSTVNAANMVAGIGTSVAGGLIAGPGGFIAGGALSGAGIEYSATMMQEIEASGYDLSDPASLREAFKDELMISTARNKAITRAVAIGTTDAVLGKLATKVVAPQSFRPSMREAANVAIQTPLQAGVEMTGEAVAQVASGDELNMTEVVAEGLGGGLSAPVDITAAAATGVRGERSLAREKVRREVETTIQSVADQGAIDEMVELAQSFKETEISADKLTEALTTMEVSEERIFIAPEAVQDAIDAGVEVDSPTIMAQLADAAANGGEIELTTAEFVAEVARSDAIGELRPSFRMNEYGKTQGDLNISSFDDFLSGVMEEADQKASEVQTAEAVLADVEQKLVDTGVVPKDEAASNAAVVAAYVESVAAERGLSADEIYGDMGLEIQGPDQTQAVEESTDTPVTLLEQDFGDTMISEDVIAEGTDTVLNIERPAQEAWDDQRKRMNMAEQLRKCLG